MALKDVQAAALALAVLHSTRAGHACRCTRQKPSREVDVSDATEGIIQDAAQQTGADREPPRQCRCKGQSLTADLPASDTRPVMISWRTLLLTSTARSWELQGTTHKP